MYVDFYLAMVIKLFTKHLQMFVRERFFKSEHRFFLKLLSSSNYFCTDLCNTLKITKSTTFCSISGITTSTLVGIKIKPTLLKAWTLIMWFWRAEANSEFYFCSEEPDIVLNFNAFTCTINIFIFMYMDRISSNSRRW